MEDMTIKKNKLIIFTTIIFGFNNIIVYAQTEIDNDKKQGTEEIVDSNKETVEGEVVEYFTVDNNTYKILKQDKNGDTVMLWKCKKLGDTGSIIINNEVNYNGQIFKVKYIYEKAFYNINKNVKNVVIDEKVLGFCDSSENVVESIDDAFKDQKQLKSVDFKNNNFIFGKSCFQNCSLLLNIDLPKNMSIMEGKCFDGCYSLKKIDLGEITKFNGQSSFSICKKLESIGEFNDKLIELPERTFTSCSILKINSLKNITKLGAECFKNCILLDKNIVTGVEEIGDNCFWGCTFKEVYLKKAKKVGYNAFGGIVELKKIRFGNPKVPFLENNIASGSRVNEWAYPLSYKTQPDYLEFLSKLKTSKVIWYSNYENKNGQITQSVRLNSLIPPSITREGYEIEGWYKEPECINKVKMIADLGIIIDSDIVIKDPVLYAKWTAKKSTMPEEPSDSKDPSKPGGTEEPSDPKDPPKPGGTEEPSNPKDPPKPGGTEESSDPKDPPKPEGTEEPSNPKDPPKPEGTEEPSVPKDPPKPGKTEEPSDSKDPPTTGVTEESSEPKDRPKSRKTEEPRKTKNNFIIKIEDKNRDVDIQETKKPSTENEIIKNVFASTSEKSHIEIKDFSWSYRDNVNSKMGTVKSGTLNKIIKNDQCIGIYLKSSDYFDNKTIIQININNIIKPSKLYSYSEELGKFILIDENLKINDDIIEFRPTSQKQYLITQIDLNENNIAIQGWNKVLPKPNTLLSKHINELSWVYLQGEELSKGWVKDFQDNNWYFMNEKRLMETGWLKYKNDKWYYLNTISDGSKGAMKIGWNKINNEWYYFQNDGVLAVNTIIDGYAVGYDGKLI